MYAINGITGRVGGAVARNLLSKNQSVRDANKGNDSGGLDRISVTRTSENIKEDIC